MSTEIHLLGRFEVVVDGRPVPVDAWNRRHASALVKLLALAPGRSLHRERVVDALWPDVPVADAAPRLHKAAHYARRALGHDAAVVLRAETVSLLPQADVVVDVAAFVAAADRALEAGTEQAAQDALRSYGGELLPADLYEEWAEADRDAIRSRHHALLRQAGRWSELVALEPSDEQAHLELMRLQVRDGDRRGALRQYERMDRALRQELGVGPSRAAIALRDQLLSDEAATAPSSAYDDDLVGRERELRELEALVSRAGRRAGSGVLLTGPAGAGKSVLLSRVVASATGRGWRTGQGSASRVEGAWPYAPVLEALADLCRQHPALLDGLGDDHRAAIDRALGLRELAWTPADDGHQRLFVAVAELVRLPAAGAGVLLAVDDLQEADEASLRLVHYLSRACLGERVLLVLAHRRPAGNPALEQMRASLLERGAAVEVSLGALDADAVRDLVERHVRGPEPELLEQITVLSDGLPFAVLELSRTAAASPGDLRPAMALMTARLPVDLRDVLVRVAVAGGAFDTDEFVALSGLSESDALDLLDAALSSGVLYRSRNGHRFRQPALREALLAELPVHRRRVLHREAAARLEALGATPAQVGHHLLAAGDTAAAVPYVLRAARTEAAVGAYRDALDLLETVRSAVTGEDAAELHVLRADLLAYLGEPEAVVAYREAVRRTTGERNRHARAGLARAAIGRWDGETAAAALEGLELDGGPTDAEILLARGHMAYLNGDVDEAGRITQDARRLLAAADDSWQALDLVTLQGMIAHHRGEWFERLTMELRDIHDAPRLVAAVFDANLCVAEYLLYGPMPYDEVIRLARDLRSTAERAGALRGVAFADTLVGEAALMSGDLDLAASALQESVDLNHEIGAKAGEANALQRLAEVRLALGDRAGAQLLLQKALPLARWSSLGSHLLQRIHGTMILAAPDPAAARAVVELAEASTNVNDGCQFCGVMFDVPATMACAAVGDLDQARAHLASAARSTQLWPGTAWQAATLEASAHIARAEGDPGAAARDFARAADIFAQAGHPLDAARCRAAAAAVSVPEPRAAEASAVPAGR